MSSLASLLHYEVWALCKGGLFNLMISGPGKRSSTPFKVAPAAGCWQQAAHSCQTIPFRDCYTRSPFKDHPQRSSHSVPAGGVLLKSSEGPELLWVSEACLTSSQLSVAVPAQCCSPDVLHTALHLSTCFLPPTCNSSGPIVRKSRRQLFPGQERSPDESVRFRGPT